MHRMNKNNNKKGDTDRIASTGNERTLLRFIVPVYQNSLEFSFECSCVDTLFQIGMHIIPVFWSINDEFCIALSSKFFLPIIPYL